MTKLQPRSKSGFTLVELLVVMAIIGILVGMLLPAVQMVREAARKTTCTNNIRQLALSCQMYHDTHQQIPPTRPRDDFLTWPVLLLPYLEQQNLYDGFDLNATYALQNSDVVQKGVPGLYCPSRRSPAILSRYETDGAHVGSVGDYAGNAGTSVYYPDDDWAQFTNPTDGVFSSGYDAQNPVDMSGRLVGGWKGRYNYNSVTDGLSNTIFFGEKAVSVRFEGEPGGWGDGCIYNGSEPGTAMRIGGFGMGIASSNKITAPGPGTLPIFGSYHPTMSNFSMGDGSVQTLAVSTSEDVLRKLCARNDGEIVTLE